jgi:uncharacterized membrane protein
MADLKMLIYDIVTIAYVLIAIAIFVPWALLSLGRYDPGFLFISDTVYQFFSFFCHQLPERSLFLDGIKMPVCARCSSIYVATSLGLVFFRLKGYGRREFRMNWLLFALLFIPTALDGFTQLFGWRESTNLLRLVTGFPYGLGYAYGIAWALPFIYTLLELIGVCMKRDTNGVNAVIKRLIAMVWPPI